MSNYLKKNTNSRTLCWWCKSNNIDQEEKQGQYGPFINCNECSACCFICKKQDNSGEYYRWTINEHELEMFKKSQPKSPTKQQQQQQPSQTDVIANSHLNRRLDELEQTVEKLKHYLNVNNKVLSSVGPLHGSSSIIEPPTKKQFQPSPIVTQSLNETPTPFPPPTNSIFGTPMDLNQLLDEANM